MKFVCKQSVYIVDEGSLNGIGGTRKLNPFDWVDFFFFFFFVRSEPGKWRGKHGGNYSKCFEEVTAAFGASSACFTRLMG